MFYQDHIVRSTQKALEDLCRSALAVPEDRAEWVPMGNARSALSQMQEIATAGKWFLPMIRDRVAPEFDEHAAKEAARLRRSYDSIEKCVGAARESTNELLQAIAQFPDEGLEDEVRLPFGGGMTMTMAEVLSLHWWNITYHLGQINQIQLMLGDTQMH
jgi:uncharacterized damage-inducible protein DinB